MPYVSTKETAQRWDVSPRQVERMLVDGRIPGAKRIGRTWMVPLTAEKPVDARRREARKQGEPAKSSQCVTPSSDAAASKFSGFRELIAATVSPLPTTHVEAFLSGIQDSRIRLPYESELAYLRGDFRFVLDAYAQTAGDDSARLRACPVTIAAAISLGDYHAYAAIDVFLRKCAHMEQNRLVASFAELALATAAISAIAPNLAPEWLKTGDLSVLVPQARMDALYLRAKYLFSLRRPKEALAVAQTALTLVPDPGEITVPNLYLRLTCAEAYYMTHQLDAAETSLLEALHIAMPHGFITPFAEAVTAMGGLMEGCLEKAFPDMLQQVLAQWQQSWKNWIHFHNRFTRDRVTLILSLREYHMAMLIAQHVPYAEVARRFHISVGRMKNIMQEVYGKLLISGRNELAAYLL